LKEDDIR